MKTVLIALVVLACALPLRADILANGDFTDGPAHWKGDAKEITSDDLTAGNQPGVVVTLKKDAWTKIYQTFSTHEKEVQYSITFKLSSDYQVDQSPYDPSSGSVSGPSPGLDDIEGVYPLYAYTYNGVWTLVVREFGGTGWNYIHPRPDPKKTDSQTLTGSIRRLTDHAEKILILAFPPGKGTVTLTNITLTSTNAQPSPF
jgi:hypothetical protein